MNIFFFFFQAEDGIRDLTVTGVQTCALPIFTGFVEKPKHGAKTIPDRPDMILASMGNYIFKANVMIDVLQRNALRNSGKIGRASCRKSVDLGGRRIIKKKDTK